MADCYHLQHSTLARLSRPDCIVSKRESCFSCVAHYRNIIFLAPHRIGFEFDIRNEASQLVLKTENVEMKKIFSRRFWEQRLSGDMVFVFLLLVIFIILFVYEKNYMYLRQIDTTFYVEAIDSVAKVGKPLSVANHSSADFLRSYSVAPESVCSMDLSPTEPLATNILNNHAYYIVYFLGALAYIVPAELLAPASHIFSFLGLLAVAFFFLRSFGVAPRHAILFCLLVVAYPNWSEALNGQYYFDRLFLFVGLLLCVLSYQLLRKPDSRRLLAGVVAVAVVAASIHERSAIFTSGFLIAFAVLFRTQGLTRKAFFTLLFMGVCLAIYAAGITYTFHSAIPSVRSNQEFYLSMFDLTNIMNRLAQPTTQANLIRFLFVNFCFVFLFMRAAPRLMIIALGAMIPNIMFTVGGAELSGWSTHYHTTYVPFMIFTAATGYAQILASGLSLKKLNYFFSGIVIVILLLLSFNIYGYSGKLFSLSRIGNHIFIKATEFAFGDQTNSYRYVLSKYRELDAAVPKGIKVTTEEGFFKTLIRDRTIFNYPIGLDIADVAVLSVSQDPATKRNYFSGAISPQGAEKQLMINLCLNKRLEAAGYDVKNPTLIYNFAVLRRLPIVNQKNSP